jgi:putative membrane protein
MPDAERTPAVLPWALIAAWAAVTLASVFAPALVSFNLARYINVTLMSAFVLVHASRRYGLSGALGFFVIAVVVTNVFENMSIVTGFPFGRYHHTAAMGPQLFHVPLIVGPIFAIAGYLGWVLAGILLGEAFTARRIDLPVARPLIAAFITTSWDLCVDPIGGTLNRDWVWADGGGYFGVPWLNFFGWMLTTWIIFQLFALFLTLRGATPRALPDNRYWLQAVVFWILIALQFPLVRALAPDVIVTDPTGAAWRARDLLETMALASFFTMVFTAVLCLFLLDQRRRAPTSHIDP